MVDGIRDLQRLREAFEAAGIYDGTYSLDGFNQGESYCIQRWHGGWAVFYAERGERTGEEWFAAEAQACRRLYEWVMSDPSTRRRPG